MEDGRVVTPPGFVEAYRQYVDDGWAALCGPVEAGGQGLPESIGGVVGEMFVSANMSWKLYSGLTGQRRALPSTKQGTEGNAPQLPAEARERRVERHDGADRTARGHRPRPHAHARRAGRPDAYRITGTKIFITSGEHDLDREHRPHGPRQAPGRAAGSRGISMFLVPKRSADAEGKPGAANGVSCASVEHKLGIHGSATCVMNFDNARGWLIGEVNGGLKNMFTMMNHARLWVGLQGLAQCERGIPGLARLRARAAARAATSDGAARDRPTRSSGIRTCGACC